MILHQLSVPYAHKSQGENLVQYAKYACHSADTLCDL